MTRRILSDPNYLDAFQMLLAELEDFQPALVRKDRVIIATKTDLEGTEEALEEIRKQLPNEEIIPISVFARTGIDEVRLKLLKMAH